MSKNIIYFYFTFIFIQFSANSVYGQKPIKRISDLEISLLKDSLTFEGNAYVFNNIRVNNTGQASHSFNIDLDIPVDWSKLIDQQKLYTIQPGETLIIPFRIAAPLIAQSDISYTSTLKFLMPSENISEEFKMLCFVKSRSSWKISLPNNSIFKQVTSENATFPVLIRNLGNISEHISLSFKDNVGLNIPDILNIAVPPEIDTLIQVSLPADDRFQNAKEVRIIVEASSKSKEKQSAEQVISALNSSLMANKSPWFNLPLTLELSAQNAFTDGQIFTVNGEMTLDFKEDRALSINFQSGSLYGAQGGQSFYQAQYRSKGINISAGDQTGFKNFQMMGYGVRITIPLRKKPQEIQLSAIKSKLNNTSQFTYQHQFTLKKGSFSIENYGFFDPDRGINSYISELLLKRSLGENTTVSLLQAGGFEDINQPALTAGRLSSRTAFQLSSKIKKFNIRSNIDKASKYYPGFSKGLFSTTNDIGFINKPQSYSVFWNMDYRNSLQESGVYENQLGLNKKEYGLKYGLTGKTWSNTLSVSSLEQTEAGVDSVKSSTYKLGLVMNKSFGQNTLNLAVSVGKVSLPGLDSIKSTSFVGGGTFQLKNIGLNARYEYGFAQLGDLYAFLKTGQIPERLNGNLFIENSLFKKTLQLRNQVDFNLNYSDNTKNVSLKSDLIFNPRKSSIQLKISYSRNFNKIGNSNINISLRKNLNLPIFGIRKFQTMEIMLFKDINADSIYNEGDEPLSNATILINGKAFISDADGKVAYRNISKGVYDIDLTLSAQKSWVPRLAYKQSIDVTKETNVYIPYKKTSFFTGKVILNKAQNSKKTFSINNIKIIAVNSTGETFTTLTTQDGSFSFSIPEDRYEVRIISSSFDSSFQLTKSVLIADLKNQSAIEPLQFIINEQERKINIRKPKDN